MTDLPMGLGSLPSWRTRYAIGEFTSWTEAGTHVRGLLRKGSESSGLSLLALAEHHPAAIPGLEPPQRLILLGRGPGPALWYCGASVGGLFAALFGAGHDIRGAFSQWLIPAHAASLASALERGQVLLWAAVPDPDRECGICLGMLRQTRRTVQIHDFQVP